MPKQQLSEHVLMRTYDSVYFGLPLYMLGLLRMLLTSRICECVLCPLIFEQLGHS